MNEISKLLQEAKPLYKARKKRNQQIKNTMLVLVCFWCGWIFSLDSNPIYNIDDELYIAECGGYIEDIGLPTDDFGILKVS